ncbi:conserved hypothetical protein [Leishmania braziliensis MHOM/BR/75/M2904]|uniref:Uncharacterized protein n=2 Tax=Leishmania braziliensis TaxID=5660 RepID=A4HLL8_LEIBR|nr:conserved hypothetical protein [Leishmania braziliensis MHOM/BR/75/M2904]KAI5687004.1 hypothetical protein MNV84_07041 [Leishmania braziliensis]CAJ2479477.1 unnamed protein product [Leishmania braziliensis]CAJ2479868.1 unnamed protein product [Leishmania braziliensis]CAM40714.1 conserved hypothetical protein [Leishmania braziliensis MHOM/BR/75/M2904]SYZ69122.1 hypothetical_protein [Leishmania braziliensis MHOM/BR/75/M2904]
MGCRPLCGRLLSCLKRGGLWRSVRSGNYPDDTWALSPQCSARHATSSSVTLNFAAASATTSNPVSSLHDAFVSRFSAQLLSSPHRDITHVPYGDWFALYVQARKHWHSLESASTCATSATREQRKKEGKPEQTEAFEAREQRAKQAIDALLLSSVFARHWTEVQPSTTSSSSPLSTYRWWWHRNSLFTAAPANAQDGEAVSPSLELCTPAFLTEPLLGGNHLRLWMEDIRASSGTTGVSRSAHDAAAAPTVILPFSTLWVVKQSAYWRPSAAPEAGVGESSGAASSSHETPTFTLQERQARQALLQSVDQLLQLQRDTVEHRKGTSGLPVDQLQHVCVLSPTQEWDLLCCLPRYRQALYNPARAASPKSTIVSEHSAAACVSSPRWLSLSCLCEDTTARLAYCTRVLNWRWQLKSSTNAATTKTTPVTIRVLSPSTEHAHLRSLSLFSLHEQSCMKASLQRRHAARRQSSSAASGESLGTTVHEQARKGCSDAARRMSHREENIRQSFSAR